MYQYVLLLILLSSFFTSCGSSPPAESDVAALPPAEQDFSVDIPMEPVEEELPGEIVAVTVSKDVYEQTLAEVKQFIDDLNKAISSKNYNAWKSSLSNDYFVRISSSEFLAAASESPLLKVRKIVLKTSTDYFTQVVVPSRANSKVDEIEFSDDHTIKAYYVEARTKQDERNEAQADGRRLRLYELAKFDDAWKIIN